MRKTSVAAQSSIPGLDLQRLPRHVAIIMDGNRRWAKRRGLPPVEGHRRGIIALREITRAASDIGIPVLTVYGFSTENWRRDSNEISFLLDLCVYFAKHELAELQKNNVRVRVLGAYQELPDASRRALEDLMAETAQNTGVLLNLAINYSSRLELERAVQNIAREVADGKLRPEQIDDALIGSYMYTADLPEPDILIRPGGEHRLSNFLLYQAAYTELVMTETFWPDFGKDEFVRALVEFQKRQRRFGGA